MPRKDPEARRVYQQRYHQANRDKILAQQHAYRAARPGENAARCRVYNAAHKEELLEKSRSYQAAHRPENAARCRAYHQTHQEEKRVYGLAYRQAHKAERAATMRAYQEANRDRLLVYYRAYNEARKEARAAYYAAHKAEACAKTRAWREAHRAHRVAYDAAYGATHKPEGAIIAARRRAIKRNAPVNDFSVEQWHEIQEMQEHRCYYCQKRCKGKLTQDHITPLSQGGSHTASNIVGACKSCNCKKFTGPPPVPVQPLLLTVAPAKKKKTS